MNIPLDCIHQLPSEVADLVDVDYWCPVVIYTKAMLGKGWGHEDSCRWLTDSVYIKSPSAHDIEMDRNDNTAITYNQKYNGTSYFVVMDVPEITDELLSEALDILNEALANHTTVNLIEYTGHTFYHKAFIERLPQPTGSPSSMGQIVLNSRRLTEGR